MNTQDGRAHAEPLERTSVLLHPETMAALRELARVGDRPLSREIRRALEAHVDLESAKDVA